MKKIKKAQTGGVTDKHLSNISKLDDTIGKYKKDTSSTSTKFLENRLNEISDKYIKTRPIERKIKTKKSGGKVTKAKCGAKVSKKKK